MVKAFLKIALRHIVKYKFISAINILGLAAGIACCLLVSLFIIDELSYDKQNKDANRIYRIAKDFINDDGSKIPEATTPPGLAEEIQKGIPEVENITRLFSDPGLGSKFYIRNGKYKFNLANVYHADSSFFNVFTIKFLKGNSKTALRNPNSAVLTESIAKKYFSNEDPIGKTLNIDDWDPVIITAIVEDIPENAHFRFEMLLPLSRFMNLNAESRWSWSSYYTYYKLQKGASIRQVDNKIRSIFAKNQPGNKDYYYSQPLLDIHLTSNLKWELKANNDKTYLYIFGTIAILILLIACINYINLTTARSSLRSKEIGVRKICGSTKKSLIQQFLTESILTSFFAFLLALIIAELFLPSINKITNKNLAWALFGNVKAIFYLLDFTLVVGLIAGIYPALYLSSIDAVKVLKGSILSSLKTYSLRKFLVVTQFSISIILIVATTIIKQQVDFIQNAKPGFDKDNILVVSDGYYLNTDQATTLKNEWLQISGVKNVATSDGVLGGRNWTNNVKYKGSTMTQAINYLNVDSNFIGALNIKIKEGERISLRPSSDSDESIFINETAVKQLGIPNPVIGKQVAWHENPLTKEISFVKVAGVVKDFHFSSLKTEIKPFAFIINNKRKWYFNIKFEGSKINYTTIAAIKDVWDRNIKFRPFQYAFLDETFAKLYASETNFKSIFSYITYLAIFIACLGLFGLSSFITKQRMKEIGIRKILGASATKIIQILTGDFLKLILLSSAISFPLAWLAMNHWLRDFAYRIDISVWVFIYAGSLALLIGLFTICFHAIRAAITNPVKSLRIE